jgi:3D (Asp-Asp-Asp) domain-containing protein
VVWYGPALVARARSRSTLRLAGVLLALGAAGVSVAGAARPGDALRVQAQTLDTRAHHALLDLYALDSHLHAARTHAAALEIEAANLRREQLVLAQELAATRQTLVVSQRRLSQNLSLLYKQGDVSPLAVVLGAASLDDALTRLDDLSRVADQSEQVVVVASHARSRLDRLRSTLIARRTRLAAALEEAHRTESTLAAARGERVAFIASLRRRRQLKAAQIRALESTAQHVVVKSDELQAAAIVEPQVVVAAGRRTIVVSSTGYSLRGSTASGMPVGYGVVAVDPSVIPLGSRLTIPGYGEAVAADTGGAVRGATIDLWFPTLAQARAWGRRTITIALH